MGNLNVSCVNPRALKPAPTTLCGCEHLWYPQFMITPLTSVQPQTEHILIVVKTYPTPSRSTIEASCTAGVTNSGEFVRIFPVPFRHLDGDRQFQKYQEITARVLPTHDYRPESRKIDPDSIAVIGSPLPTTNGWEERRQRVGHLMTCCMCCLQKEQRAKGSPTLGFFRPHEIQELKLEPTTSKWTDVEAGKLAQESFWKPEHVHRLEKIPFQFKYRYRCPHNDCRGHLQSCTDWEMSESYRKWRREYGDSWEEKFRMRYETDMSERFDTCFFTGTMHQHPNSWLIVGLWYPRKGPRQLALDLR